MSSRVLCASFLEMVFMGLPPGNAFKYILLCNLKYFNYTGKAEACQYFLMRSDIEFHPLPEPFPLDCHFLMMRSILRRRMFFTRGRSALIISRATMQRVLNAAVSVWQGLSQILSIQTHHFQRVDTA